MPENPREYLNEANGEASLLSFVIRLWKEEVASEEQQTSWRGHITSVPNGKRLYFTNISEIPVLLAAHLKAQQ